MPPVPQPGPDRDCLSRAALAAVGRYCVAFYPGLDKSDLPGRGGSTLRRDLEGLFWAAIYACHLSTHGALIPNPICRRDTQCRKPCKSYCSIAVDRERVYAWQRGDGRSYGLERTKEVDRWLDGCVQGVNCRERPARPWPRAQHIEKPSSSTSFLGWSPCATSVGREADSHRLPEARGQDVGDMRVH